MTLKKTKLIITLFAIGALLVPIAFSSGEYNVVIGDSFGYDIIKSTVSQTYDGVSRTGQGFMIENEYFNEGTMVTVEVTGIDEYGVSASISAGTATGFLYSPREFEYHFEEILTDFYTFPPKGVNMSEANYEAGLNVALFQVFIDPVQVS